MWYLLIITVLYILCLKLENKLKAQIDAWEGEQGREFLVNGQKFLQYVEEQWELHRIEKEKEKLERVSKELDLSFDVRLSNDWIFLFPNILPAPKEEQTDWGGHALWNHSTNSNQTKTPGNHDPE